MFSKRTEWKLALNRFTEAQQKVTAKGGKIYDLTISNPTRAGLDVDLSDDRKAISKGLTDARIADYDPKPKGLLHAREAVREYYRERNADVDAESLILTASTSEG